MRVSRQAKDRRFWVRLARTSAWCNNLTDQVSSQKMCMVFSTPFTSCACSFATGFAWKSVWTGKTMFCTMFCGYVWKTERNVCIFKFIRIRVDKALAGGAEIAMFLRSTRRTSSCTSPKAYPRPKIVSMLFRHSPTLECQRLLWL